MHSDSNSNNKIVTFDKVSKIYKDSNQTALKEVNFSIREGEFVCIIGPSGEGKSTVLKIVAGLEKETSGRVTKPTNVSMVFQSIALFPWLTVFDNIAIGLRAVKTPENIVKKIVDVHILMMGLRDHEFSRPADLSGGQRQRVGIARALSVEPDILLLDEPFSALDAKTTAELHEDLLKIWKEHKKTIIMVSHSIEEAVSLSERIILIKKNEVSCIFNIEFPYPRREQGARFEEEVSKIRKEFFKN